MRKDYTFGPPESWVDLKPPKHMNKPREMEADVPAYMIYYDRQVNLTDKVISRFVSYEEYVQTPMGIESAAQFMLDLISWDQHVVFHQVEIVRDGQVLDRKKTCHVTIENKERTQGQKSYEGYKSITLLIEGVMVGDYVRVSCTTFGRDPTLKNHFSEWFFTQIDQVSNWYRYKIIAPLEKNIYFRNFNTDIKPEIKKDGKTKSYTWIFHPEEEPYEDEDLPDDYEYLSYVQISDFTSWSEVVELIAGYYSIPKDIPQVLSDRIANIESEFKDLESRVVACLKFVQNEIRYLNLEDPHLTVKPNSLDDILSNGFGDCKDKSFLACTMLSKLGVEVYPALIYERNPYLAKNSLPCSLFDHVIICAEIEGKTYWIDATARCEVNNLKNRVQENRGYALLLKPGQNSLSELPVEMRNRLEIEEHYDFTACPKGPVFFRICSKYYGFWAENVRDSLYEETLLGVSKSYLAYYGGYFNGIEIKEHLRVEDDRENNIVTLYESYVLPSHESFPMDEENVYVRALAFDDNMDLPEEDERETPYGISFPEDITHKIEAHFKKKFPFFKENKKIENKAFVFTREHVEKGNVISLTNTYKTLRDRVEPDDFADYYADIYNAYNITDLKLPLALFENISVFHRLSKWQYIGIGIILWILLGVIVTIVSP